MRRIPAALFVTVILATLPAVAQAITFGPNLSGVEANDNAQATCAYGVPTLGAPGSRSCMWTAIGNGIALTTPASGVITAVRVKVGNHTGRMRVNVIRLLYQRTADHNYPASLGPFLIAYGPTFTPRPNAVTTVRTRLPVVVDPTPDYYDLTKPQRIDGLALEVLEPNVPIPVFSFGSALSYAIYPGPTELRYPAPSERQLPVYGTSGFGVAMNADLATNGNYGESVDAGDLAAAPERPAISAGGAIGTPLSCVVAGCPGVLTVAADAAS